MVVSNSERSFCKTLPLKWTGYVQNMRPVFFATGDALVNAELCFKMPIELGTAKH